MIAGALHNMEKLCELILLKEFKTCLLTSAATYVSEQKVATAQQAAVLADKFAFSYKVDFRERNQGKFSNTNSASDHDTWHCAPFGVRVLSGSASIVKDPVTSLPIVCCLKAF